MTEVKRDRAKRRVKMTADGTEVDHNKRDIDDQNKETKVLTADGGLRGRVVGTRQCGDDRW